MKKPFEIIMDIYRELYINATPSVDFDELMAASPVIDGVKQIPYMDYEIEDRVMDAIIEKHLKKNKVKKHLYASYRFEVYLGCSPQSKREDKE